MLESVRSVRKQLAHIGAGKLWHLLQSEFRARGISLGRDRFYRLLRTSGLLLYPHRSYRPRTTNSKHWMRTYPNLIAGMVIDRPDQVYVSDITYVSLHPQFCYLSLITDAYSHKIVGYAIEDNLTAGGPLRAVHQALAQRKPNSDGTYLPLIHHSDRGSQYCSERYVRMLQEHGVQISMTENGSPYENAIAERLNGILKYEFGIIGGFATHREAARTIRQGIRLYNDKRPHLSCDYLTPNQAHQRNGALLRRWNKRVYPTTKSSV